MDLEALQTALKLFRTSARAMILVDVGCFDTRAHEYGHISTGSRMFTLLSWHEVSKTEAKIVMDLPCPGLSNRHARMSRPSRASPP